MVVNPDTSHMHRGRWVFDRYIPDSDYQDPYLLLLFQALYISVDTHELCSPHPYGIHSIYGTLRNQHKSCQVHLGWIKSDFCERQGKKENQPACPVNVMVYGQTLLLYYYVAI